MAKGSSDTVSFRLDAELVQGLEKLAMRTGRSKTFVMEEALASYLDANVWQVEEIERAVREADAGDFASDEEVAALRTRYLNTDVCSEATAHKPYKG